MKKRLLLPFSLLCLAGMIVACGQQGGNSSNQTSEQPTSSDTSPVEPQPSSTSSQGGGNSSSSSQTPTSSSVETPVNYEVSITNKANLEEEWFASDGNRTLVLSCSPGVVKSLLGKEIFVASSDESIVKVENNQVLVPVAPGKVTITVIYHNAYASVKVAVKGMTRPATIEEIAKGVAAKTIDENSKAVELYGTVTGIYGNTAIIQEGDYAMYVYNKNYEGIKVGDRAHLIATYYLYSGLPETKTVTIFEKSTKEAEEIKAKDIAAADFASLSTEDASRLVNVSGIYSLGESLSKGGCAAQAVAGGSYRLSSVKIGDLETYIFVNKYLDEDVINAINAKLNQAEADSMKIEVKGGHIYCSTSYMERADKTAVPGISITSADQLTLTESDIITLPTKVELTGALDKICVEDGFKLTPKFTPANTNRKGLTYASSNEAVATVSKDGLVVGKGVGEATITATSSAEGAENVKATINVKVAKAQYVTNPEDGKSYYFGLSQQNLAKRIYLNGEMDGYYFKTVDDLSKAALVKVEKGTEDGKYALKAGEKYLKIEVGGAYVNTVLSDDPFYFTWDADKCAFYENVTTCTNNKKNGKCYLGTSGTYVTISAANNQKFFAHLYPESIAGPVVENPFVEKLVEGERYTLGLDHTKVGKELFMTGAMDEKSPTYGATAEFRGNGLTYTAEKSEVNGEFFLKGDDGKYLSIVKPEGKTFYTVDFTAEKKVAWSLDEETSALQATYDGDTRMMGTSNTKTYTTIGIIKASAKGNNFLVRAYPEFSKEFVEGGKYVVGLYQAGVQKNLFMTGAMDEKSPTYGATVEGKANGLVYTAEKSSEEGKFYLKGSDGKYLSVVKPEGKTFYTVDFTAEKKVAWGLDETYHALVGNYDGSDRMMGTSNSKTYTTIGIIKTTAAGSNYLVRAYQVGYEAPATPADPEPQAQVQTLTENVVVTAENLLGSSTSAAYAADEKIVTISGVKIASKGCGCYGNGIQMRYNHKTTGTSTIYNTEALSFSKLVLRWAATQNVSAKDYHVYVEFSSSADFSTLVGEQVSVKFDATTKLAEVTLPAGANYFRITHANQGAVYMDSITLVA